MGTRRDKAKVIDEVWDDERIASFLHRLPPDGDASVDHVRLLGAYQGMRIGDFRRFLVVFVAAGGELDAPDERGRTITEVIARHRHGTAFVEALVAQGARAPSTPAAQET